MKEMLELGLTPFFTAQLSAEEIDSGRLVRIVQVHRSRVIVSDSKVEKGVPLGGGWFDMHAINRPTVGDWVLLDATGERIERLLERKSIVQRVVPGSQHWAPINVPYVNVGDWEPQEPTTQEAARIPKDLGAPYPGEVLVEAPAGSVVICNASMWHSGTVKKTDSHRRMLHLTYTRRDLPQQLLQMDHLTKALYDRMSPAQRYLLEIEPPREGEALLRQPQKDHAGWWN